MPGSPITIVLWSDTHGYHERCSVPDGDLFIHAGDLAGHGSLEELRDFDRWLGTLPHRHKVIISGNHDWCFEREARAARKLVTNAIYLQDELVEIEGLRIYGSPWQPWFLDWAFNLQRGPELAEKWAAIPANVDILVTHGPPAGILDLCHDGSRVGCEDLAARIGVVRPKLHVFGHIHEARGWHRDGRTLYVNASADFGDHPPFVTRNWEIVEAR